LRGAVDDGEARPELAQERARSFLGVADQELQRLRRSLDSLLNHAALPRDDLEELDARDLLRDVENLLGPQCARQKVALSVRVPEAPVRVLGTRDALKQALINLGINALEAMPDGGTLNLCLEGHNSKATILVADSGPGIPPEIRDRIFTMHYTTKGTGTGIGLYVARVVVEATGGEIRVDQQAERGATFRIDLPTMGPRG
jgi:signal transduction histidine kinase